MKRNILMMAAALTALMAAADYQEGYYDALDGKMKADLKQAAKSCVADHVRLDYTDLPNNWEITDVYPYLFDGSLRWWDMYSDHDYLIKPGETGLESFRRNNMQREHSVPKSWWKEDGDEQYTAAYTDLWNLYPSDGSANNAKSNHPLGIVGNATFNNGVSKVGTPAEGFGGKASIVFEPADIYKGDFARGYFYVATVYDDIKWQTDNNESMFEPTAWPTLQPWAYTMLLDWARKDPVSMKEVKRNEEVEGQQGNRNPFVDFPLLQEYIWGEKTAEPFYIAQQPAWTPTPYPSEDDVRPGGSGGDDPTGPSNPVDEGDGTKEHPYNIAQVKASTVDQDNVWVEGYIVGYISSGNWDNSSYFAPDASVDTNIILGELASTDNTDAAIPVGLKKGEARTNVNLKDNPGNYRKRVKLKGTMKNYFGVRGVRDVTEYEFVKDDDAVGRVADEALIQVGAVEGGVCILVGAPRTNFRIFDLSGRVVVSAPVVYGGEYFPLEKGIYIITADASGRPVKVVIN